MQAANIISGERSSILARIATLMFFFGVGCGLVALTMQLASKVEPGQLVIYSGYALLLSILAGSSFAYTRRALTDAPAVFAVLRAVWLFLLIDDFIFNFGRQNPLSNELRGKFTSAAYGEVILWVVSAVILVIVSLPRLKEVIAVLFAAGYRWMTFFFFLCVLSAVYSIAPAYSLAWSFKLGLDVLMIALMSVCMRDESGILSLLRTTALSIGVVLVMALLQIAVDPANAFEQGRLGGIAPPTELSELGGLLMLISLVFYGLEKARWSTPALVLGSTVMMLGGGKIAIAAALLSVGVFFALQRKVGSGVAVFAGLALVAFMVLLVTPTGRYFSQYAASDQASTLTGRVDLWKAELPDIKNNLVLGHGYLASKFVPAPFKQGDWQVGSLHNAYLDVLYNLGLIGLAAILLINYWIVKNLVYARKHAGNEGSFEIACGLLAIYLALLIDSPFAVPFGGRPSTYFMVFLALLGMSIRLRQMVALSDIRNSCSITG